MIPVILQRLCSLYLDNTNTVMGSAQKAHSNLGFALFPNVEFPTTGVHFLQARDATDGIILNSPNIQVNPAVAISTLYFGALPSNPVVNTPLSPAITVFQKDPSGNLVSDGSFVTLNVSGGTLSGASLHQQSSGGSISFTGLTPTTNNATYTVTATDGNDNSATMVFSVFAEHLVFNYPTQTMPNFTQGSNHFLQPFTVSVVANGSAELAPTTPISPVTVQLVT